jgi:hypothetical protein
LANFWCLSEPYFRVTFRAESPCHIQPPGGFSNCTQCTEEAFN